jgi:hypothetical protein
MRYQITYKATYGRYATGVDDQVHMFAADSFEDAVKYTDELRKRLSIPSALYLIRIELVLGNRE